MSRASRAGITRHRPSFSAVPAQAAAAGFSTQGFFDDFTSSATVTNNTGFTTMQSGIKWYPGQGVAMTDPTHYHLLTGTTAAGISNGNSGGGVNASPNGGILQVTGIAAIANQGNFISAPQAMIGVSPPTGTGYMGPTGYWEGYMQYVTTGTTHVAMWTYPGTSAVVFTEVDIVELNILGNDPDYWIGNLNQWSSGSDISNESCNQIIAKDANWHTYGILISTPVSGVGTMEAYLDNVLVGSLNVGTGTNYPTVYTDANGTVKRLWVIGKNVSADIVNFDWIRYWGP